MPEDISNHRPLCSISWSISGSIACTCQRAFQTTDFSAAPRAAFSAALLSDTSNGNLSQRKLDQKATEQKATEMAVVIAVIWCGSERQGSTDGTGVIPLEAPLALPAWSAHSPPLLPALVLTAFLALWFTAFFALRTSPQHQASTGSRSWARNASC